MGSQTCDSDPDILIKDMDVSLCVLIGGPNTHSSLTVVLVIYCFCQGTDSGLSLLYNFPCEYMYNFINLSTLYQIIIFYFSLNIGYL